MKPASYHILRVAVAITFIWISVLIFKEPDAWAGLVEGWVRDILPVPLERVMITTALLDLIIGALLLIDRFVFPSAVLSALHLASVLIVTGITVITVRDIAILGAVIALAVEAYPAGFRPKTLKDYLSLLAK